MLGTRGKGEAGRGKAIESTGRAALQRASILSVRNLSLLTVSSVSPQIPATWPHVRAFPPSSDPFAPPPGQFRGFFAPFLLMNEKRRRLRAGQHCEAEPSGSGDSSRPSTPLIENRCRPYCRLTYCDSYYRRAAKGARPLGTAPANKRASAGPRINPSRRELTPAPRPRSFIKRG